MKLKSFFLLLGIFLVTGVFSQQGPTKGALTTVDTTVKPNVKMLAINQLDRLVYYWNGYSWNLVGGKPVTGSFWELKGNKGTDTSNYIGHKDSVSTFEIRNGGFPMMYITRPRSWLNNAPLTPTSFGFPAGSAVFLGFRAGEGTYLLEKANNFSVAGYNTVAIGNYAGQGVGKKLDPDSSWLTTSGAVFIGGWAGINNQYGSASDYGRTTLVGSLAGFMSVSAQATTGIGCNALERLIKGSHNTAVGQGAMRSATNASYNTAVGTGAGAYLSSVIGSITVTNPGSGYTTATVTISPPKTYAQANMPYIQENPATATAIISDGQIIGITVTDAGAGYVDRVAKNFTHGDYSLPTVTITGDGTGATATANVINATYNTYIGYLSGWRNRGGYANTGIGAGTSSVNAIRVKDTGTTYLGAFARVDPSVPALTTIKNATAVGANTTVAQSDAVILGDVTQTTNVGIGTITPNTTSMLDITSTTRGVLISRLTTAQRDAISSPAAWLMIICTDCTAGDASTGVLQVWNGSTWKNAW